MTEYRNFPQHFVREIFEKFATFSMLARQVKILAHRMAGWHVYWHVRS